MTEKSIVMEEIEKFAQGVLRLFDNLNVLQEPTSHIGFGKNLKFLDTFVSSDYKSSSGAFGEVTVHCSPNILDDLTGTLRFELSFNLQIQRDFNDHNSEFNSGFVLSWTHQKGENQPFTGGGSYVG